MSTPIVSVDELCVAVQEVLVERLADTMDQLGFDDPAYDRVKSWQQLPVLSALSAADLPAGGISASGLVDKPKRRADGTALTTWRISVGIYERGANHADTQARVRDWCAGIRTTVLARKSLGGLASALEWAGEEYALIPGREQARTIAAAGVAFDVTAIVLALPVGNLPPVISTPTSVSVQPPP